MFRYHSTNGIYNAGTPSSHDICREQPPDILGDVLLSLGIFACVLHDQWNIIYRGITLSRGPIRRGKSGGLA